MNGMNDVCWIYAGWWLSPTPLKNMKVSFFVTLSMIASLAVTEARLCLLHSQYEQSTPFLGSMAW